MWQKVKDHFNSGEDVFLIFLMWVFAACIIGAVVGLVGIAFHWTLEVATEFRIEHPMILWLLPIAGVVIIWLYHHHGMKNDRGTNFILVAVRASEPVSLRTAPLIFFSTVATHLFGGSAGREGAALQLGGSIASRLGREFKLNEKDMRIITMCGMSAGFAALFGTPLTAVIFSMEVITVGIMHYSAIVPCMVAALVAAGFAQGVGFLPTAFHVTGVPLGMDLDTAWCVGILAVLCALVSILFCVILDKSAHYYKKWIANPLLRVFVGGCLVILLTYMIGIRDYNGAGMDVIERAIRGEARPEAFLLKILLTAVTLGAGYKGGEIVPTLFVGATFGCVAGPLFGIDPSFSAGLGMAAVFCGVTNCPLASIALCIELFGIEGIGYYALCCAISYMLSGYYGLYSEQKIMYSKLKPEFIDKNVY